MVCNLISLFSVCYLIQKYRDNNAVNEAVIHLKKTFKCSGFGLKRCCDLCSAKSATLSLALIFSNFSFSFQVTCAWTCPVPHINASLSRLTVKCCLSADESTLFSSINQFFFPPGLRLFLRGSVGVELSVGRWDWQLTSGSKDTLPTECTQCQRTPRPPWGFKSHPENDSVSFSTAGAQGGGGVCEVCDEHPTVVRG